MKSNDKIADGVDFEEFCQMVPEGMLMQVSVAGTLPIRALTRLPKGWHLLLRGR